MSTIAMAKSRDACSTVKPRVVVSTTSPVEISPRRHSSTDQTSTPGGDAEHGDGVELAQPLERSQAQALRLHLVLDFHGQPLLLALRGAECPHQTDVAHDVGEIAAHMRRVPGEILMQLPPVRGPPRDDGAEHAHHRDAGPRSDAS